MSLAPTGGTLRLPFAKGERVIAEDLKPKKISFLVETIAPPMLLAVALCIGGAVAWAMNHAALAVGLVGSAGALAVLFVADALIAYGKERYVFRDHQIIRKGGGILRDSHTELNVVNITHVQLILPWPRYRLFGVGHVVIDSAGSGEHMRLRALRDPEAVYDRVRALMRDNGFSLSYRELLHEEQPPDVAVLREVASNIIAFAVVVFLGTSAAGVLIAALPEHWRVWATAALVTLVIGVAIALLAIRALDLRRRTYSVYNDAVVYTEGFLTRNNAFMPAENLADANTQQSVIDRILGIYDVTISCQGAGQEILFRGLRHGPRLSQALEMLTSTYKSVAGRKAERVVEAPAPGAAATAAVDESAAPVEIVPATFRMHVPRALVPYVIGAVVLTLGVAVAGLMARWFELPLLALLGGEAFAVLALVGLAAGAVRGILGIFVTRFELRPRSVKRRYRLLQSHETEFSNEKLTCVVHRANPFDRLFGTCSIHFCSIGASEPLIFSHVRDPGDMLERALRQAAIQSERTLDEVPSTWSLRATFGESLPLLTFTALLIAGAIVAMVWFEARFWLALPAVMLFWTLILSWEPIYYRRCRALFYDNHLEIRKGVLARKRYHARYENIKHVTTVRYPFVDCGRVLFQVAGHGAHTLVPMGFVGRLRAKNELLDRWLSGRISAEPLSRSAAPLDPEPAVRVSHPALGNTLVPLCVVSVVLVPLAALLPVTLPWAIIAVRRRHYRIESYRVVARWGVIYKRQTSIVFDKVDHIQQARGLLNKVFGNGDVRLYTAGSSSTDLEIRHIRDYQAFYADLRARYARDEATGDGGYDGEAGP